MNAVEYKIFESLKMTAKDVLPSGGHAWLYGSRARGDAREDSDWDVLILLDKENVKTEDFNAFAYPLVELGWRKGELVSPQLYTFREWSAMSFMPYYKNVEHDKIQLV